MGASDWKQRPAQNSRKAEKRALAVADTVIETQLRLSESYGCALQAYAMQQILRDCGLKPVTHGESRRRFTVQHVLGNIKAQLKLGTLDGRLSPGMKNYVWQHVFAFVHAHIDSTSSVPRRWKQRPPRFAVAGSDQVWRPRYMDVRRGAFDYLPNAVTRISYAASFGLDDASEFDGRLMREFSTLLGRFSAVSVREGSGVEICRDTFGVDAVRVLDPTMLLPVTYWDQLASSYPSATTDRTEKGYLSFMVLDPTPEARVAAAGLAKRRGVAFRDFFPPRLSSKREFRSADRAKYVMPPVEAWLAEIRDADLIVTDSFHVCVFSILFHTPFYILRNATRGNTRLDSLTSLFGLARRVIRAEELDTMQSSEIGWRGVDGVLQKERLASLTFLTTSIRAA